MTVLTGKNSHKSVVLLFLLSFSVSSYGFKVELIASDMRGTPSLLMNKKVLKNSQVDFPKDLMGKGKMSSKLLSKLIPLKLIETKVYTKNSPLSSDRSHQIVSILPKVLPMLPPLIIPPILTPFKITPVSLQKLEHLTKKNTIAANKNRSSIIDKLRELKKMGSLTFSEYVRFKKLLFK